MLNSKHLSLVNKIGDKTEFTITRVHCISAATFSQQIVEQTFKNRKKPLFYQNWTNHLAVLIFYFDSKAEGLNPFSLFSRVLLSFFVDPRV